MIEVCIVFLFYPLKLNLTGQRKTADSASVSQTIKGSHAGPCNQKVAVYHIYHSSFVCLPFPTTTMKWQDIRDTSVVAAEGFYV